ncbi:hypothetical protein KF707_09890 [Candidatus Obscuribacterales bacterium]|nr:hypothetical protein [Candidatus Obscuribacterales bacterium]
MKTNLFFIGFSFLTVLSLAFPLVAKSEDVAVSESPKHSGERNRHHHGEWHGGFSGGWSGFSSGNSITPSIVTEALLVPSLTKAQQGKIRSIYLAYRTKSRNRMDVIGKLRGDYPRGDKTNETVGVPKSREDMKREIAEKGMESSTSNLRRTLFLSMVKESEKFHSDILAVLDVKQKAELKDIAAKAGSPDYFKPVHYDKMNAVKSPGSSNDRPD